MGAFWDAWRSQIIRGAALFCVVLGVGFLVHFVVGRVRQGVADSIPAALRDLRGDFDTKLGSGPRKTAEAWTYSAKLAPQQWLWIHNVRGSVTVERGKGDSVTVTAVKSYGTSDPARVRIVPVPYEGGIAICALYRERETACRPGEEIKGGSTHRSDVGVDFTVRLPPRVRIGATTVTGSVHVTGASAPIVAVTVSGDVDAETADGPVRAVVVNGSVRARMHAFGDTGAVSIFTVNGPVTAELPARLDADVQASTVNGSITTDYPLTVTGKFTSQKLEGTLGAGGRKVHITTVNGSIDLKKALPAAPTK